jgi:hypothetical protein
MKKLLLAIALILAISQSQAQTPLVGRPSLKLVYEPAQTNKWDFTVGATNTLTINGTGGTPILRFSDYAGTGNRVLYVDSNGDVSVMSALSSDRVLGTTTGGLYTESFSSAALATSLSDESGTGNVVFTNSPALVTPSLGVATATTLNTGNGNYELFYMDQDVATSSNPTFASLALTSGLTVPNGGTGGTTFTAGRLLIGNGTSAISGAVTLQWDDINKRLGVQTAAPASTAHVYENTTSTGLTAGLTIENAGTGDAVQRFIAGANTLSMGLDNSDVDNFKISLSTALGTNNLLVFDNAAEMTIASGLNSSFVNTGAGDNELYPMDQAVTTTSTVTFGAVGVNGSLGATRSAIGGYVSELVNSANNSTAAGLLIKAGSLGGSGTLIQFGDVVGTAVGSITFTSGTTTAYNTTSDRRLKKDILPTKLDPKGLIGLAKDFTWKENGQKQTGFIAQEVYKVFPWAVHAPDSGMWSIDYGQLTPLLAKGYEDNEARITALEKENAELKAKLDRIEKRLNKLENK